MRILRQARTLLLVVLLAAAPGCFVFDEVDSGASRMEQDSGAGGKRPAPAAAPGKPAAAPAASAKAQSAAGGLKSWWETARTLGSEEGDAEIGACRVNGRTEFMLRDDCLARGGRPE